MTKEIPINSKNGISGYALVDDSDYNILSAFSWNITSNGYVCSRIGGKVVNIHKMILKNVKEVDHINRNKLDNRRCNLREATRSQNNANHEIQKNNTLGYRGVGRVTQGTINPYYATIKVNGKNIYLGVFKTIEKAALAYNKAALEYFGEFANLNEVSHVF